MRLRNLATFWLAALAMVLAPGAGAQQKTFKYAFPIAETGFDPAQISDLYSRTIAGAIFESLYTWDYLARPAKQVPNLSIGEPEVSTDFKTYTYKIKPGVFFADDPAFKGQKREVTAQDFVYSFKRHFDPKLKSYAVNGLLTLKIVGLNELREEVSKNKTPFAYDKEIEGVRALDRYTLQFKLGVSSPRFTDTFTDPSLYGVVAREVIEAYGENIMAHPVGTGAFRLAQWRRNAKIVLEKNPSFREVVYEASPPADDTLSQEIYAKLKGRRLPLTDRIEISIIEEEQPRWLAFLNAEQDMIERLPNSFANVAIPNNKLAPNLAKRGIKMDRTPLPDMTILVFNVDDALVGGYTPKKVALRRAISLSINIEEEIRLGRRNQAIPAYAPFLPMTTAYDPNFRSEAGEYSKPRAKALLDMFGYVDKGGDGWRDMPDGSPLLLRVATTPDQTQRQLEELFKKSLNAVGLRVQFDVAKWPDNLKKARAGKHMIWRLGYTATGSDPDDQVRLGFGPAKGENNLSRFDLAKYNEIYLKQQTLPDGPERQKLIEQARDILIAYAPFKAHTHRIATDLLQPWVYGYRRHPFLRDWFKYLDVDAQAQQAAKN